MTNLYYLAQEHVLGIDGEGLVDGSHLSNLGFMRQAENYLTVLNPLVLGAGWEALKDSDMGWFCEDDVLKAAQERLHAKDYENARQGFKQAMRRGRWWVMVDAQLGLAEAYQADGKMAEAKAAYLKALDLPRLTLVQRAMLKQRLFSIAKDTDKNPDQAREYLHGWRADYLSALEDKKVHDHEKTTAVYLLGYSYSTGIGYPDEMNAEQARRMWAQVEALKNPHPGYLPRVYMEWARSCLDAKQYAETRRLCEKLLALSGLDPDTRANALLLSGNASLAEGDTAGAKDAYGRAIALPGISEGMKRQVLSRLKLSDNPQ
jgi:tetratricopeptide (TPR) repeat protein